MFGDFTSLQEFKNVMNVPYAVIIASFIIIIVTTNITDTNGLSALLGGYSGLLIGMLFVIILNMIFVGVTKTTALDVFPILMILIIVGLIIYYLAVYFDKIAKGEVSTYYFSFSIVSLIFLATQIGLIFTALYRKSESQDVQSKLFSDTTFALLGLLSVINLLVVITMGIILHFYSTQG